MNTILIGTLAAILFVPITASAQIREGFSLYHSPESGFEIAYPSDWVVDESPVGEEGIYRIYINAPVSSRDEIDNSTKSVEELLAEAQRKTEDIESRKAESILMEILIRNKTAEDPDNIKAIGVQSIQSRKETFPDVNIIEASETTLAGLPAFKTVYTYPGVKEMSIETLSNDKIYTVGYSAPSYLYDVYLPEVEYAINSTKINN
jgi:hypothetical protein